MLAIAKKYFEAKKENTLCSDRNLDARISQDKFEMLRAVRIPVVKSNAVLQTFQKNVCTLNFP